MKLQFTQVFQAVDTGRPWARKAATLKNVSIHRSRSSEFIKARRTRTSR